MWVYRCQRIRFKWAFEKTVHRAKLGKQSTLQSWKFRSSLFASLHLPIVLCPHVISTSKQRDHVIGTRWMSRDHSLRRIHFIWFLTTWLTVENSSKCVFVLISILGRVKYSHYSSCFLVVHLLKEVLVGFVQLYQDHGQFLSTRQWYFFSRARTGRQVEGASVCGKQIWGRKWSRDRAIFPPEYRRKLPKEHDYRLFCLFPTNRYSVYSLNSAIGSRIRLNTIPFIPESE